MTDTPSLMKWTEEKMINEVMQLSIQRKESLNVATNKKEENNHEMTILMTKLQLERELYNQAHSEIQ